MDNKKHTILLADDEAEFRELLKGRLEMLGYTCYEASNGKEAVEITRSTPLSLIILDLVMPVMNGYEVYQAIKADESTKNIPIILFTGQDQDSVMDQGIDALDQVDFIFKPFDVKAVEFLVRKTLHHVPVKGS